MAVGSQMLLLASNEQQCQLELLAALVSSYTYVHTGCSTVGMVYSSSECVYVYRQCVVQCVYRWLSLC